MTDPLARFSRPRMHRSSVVLPQPLEPSRPQLTKQGKKCYVHSLVFHINSCHSSTILLQSHRVRRMYHTCQAISHCEQKWCSVYMHVFLSVAKFRTQLLAYEMYTEICFAHPMISAVEHFTQYAGYSSLHNVCKATGRMSECMNVQHSHTILPKATVHSS